MRRCLRRETYSRRAAFTVSRFVFSPDSRTASSRRASSIFRFVGMCESLHMSVHTVAPLTPSSPSWMMPAPGGLPVKRPLALVLPLFLLAPAVQAKPKPKKAPPTPFTVVEATITDMQKALAEKLLTSRQLVELYLQRIATYEDKLGAAITVNPKAL